MNPWWLLLIPASLSLIGGLLAATAWLEHSMLSPHRVIMAGLRSPRARAEHVEAFVAKETERLLRELGEPRR